METAGSHLGADSVHVVSVVDCMFEGRNQNDVPE